MYLQYKTAAKPRQIPKGKKVAVGTTQHYKLYWQYAPSKTTHLKSEIQCSRYRQLSSPAWSCAAAQDIAYKIHKRCQLKGRVAWFNARHTHNKLYAYEPNMQHTGFNFHAYHGRGMRYCLLMCYQPTPSFRLDLKYALTHRRDRDEIGSGQETIKGNFKNDVMLQAIFKF